MDIFLGANMDWVFIIAVLSLLLGILIFVVEQRFFGRDFEFIYYFLGLLALGWGEFVFLGDPRLMQLAFVVPLGFFLGILFVSKRILIVSMRNSWFGRNFDLVAFSLVFLIFGGGLFYYFDDFSQLVSQNHLIIDTDNAYEIIGTYVFNNPLALATLIGFPILIKRVSETRLQSRAIQYNAANELLWSEGLGSRMAGIQALWRVAQTYPQEEYHNVMDVFTQFIKYPPLYELHEKRHNKHRYLRSVRPQYFVRGKKIPAGKREDIQAILWRMGKEKIADAKPYYRIDLLGAHLEEAPLVGFHLEGAGLSAAHLEGADLSVAHLEGADLGFAYLEGARLNLTIINKADFANSIGLTQKQIKKCVFITDHPLYKQRPSLPNGIEHEYQEMSIKEWEVESRSKFQHFEI